jgi:hypothetical protein
MVNIVNVRGPSLAEDDPQIEAARQQIALAMANMRQGGPSPAGVPLAEGRGAVQAQYGWGHALTDLANKLAQGYALGQARNEYTALKTKQDEGLAADTASKLNALAPPIKAGAQASPGVTLDALPDQQPDASGLLANALAQQQPSPMAPPPSDQPVPGIGASQTLSDTENPVHAQLAAALAGMPARQANQVVSEQMLTRLFKPKEKPLVLSQGGVAFDEDPNNPGKLIPVASVPKDLPRAERKTRLLDNHMAQDYDFYGDGRPDENVGAPYKHSEPPASVVNMNDPTTMENAQSDARRVAMGLAPVPPSTGRGSQGSYNATVRRLATDMHPGLDNTTFEKRQAAEKSFAASIDGRNLDAYNTIAQHVEFGEKAFNALQNGDYPLINSLANTLGVAVGNAPPATYRNIMTFLGNETARATIGGQNAQSDRQELSKMFTDAASDPQGKANFGAAKVLIGGRMISSRRRFQSSVRTYDLDKKDWVEDSKEFDAKLTPAALAFEKLGADPGPLAGSGGGEGVIPGTNVSMSAVEAELARRRAKAGGR